MSHVTPLQDEGAERTGWRWFPLNVATALAVAVVVSLLAFLLTTSSGATTVAVPDVAEPSGEETAEPAPLAAPVETTTPSAEAAVDEPADTTETVTAGADQARAVGGDSEATFSETSHAVVAVAGDITNMGATEVGLVTNFPAVAYEWQRIEVAGSGEAEMGWLGELNGRLVAVSPTWDGNYASQSLLTSTSPDGVVWEVAGEYRLPEEAWVSRVVSDGVRIYAITEGWDSAAQENQHHLYTTSDGVDWIESPLGLSTEPGEHVYIQNVAAGPRGLVLAVSYETYPEEQPALLDFGEYQVELHHMNNRYSVYRSGDEVMSGSMEDLFNWGGEGQRIFDPETDELLTTIPWEVWERAHSLAYEGYGGGSPLPIPIGPPANDEGPPIITIEYDGLIVSLDEWGGEYTLVDADSGDVIAEGSIDYLYQGPPPRFVDPETGDDLFTVTWEDWYQAEEQAYREMEPEYHDYVQRTELLTSSDGATWTSTEVPGRMGAHVSTLLATESGFIATVSSYGEFGDHRSLWTFEEGSWSSSDADYSDLWFYKVELAGDEFIGVGEGPGGPALWSSSDGINWVTEFAVVPQDDGSYVSLTDLAVDEDGTVAALARRERWSDYRPLVLEIDGYTLTFEDGETPLRVVDAGGTVVLQLDWIDYENGTTAASWADGVTTITLDNGDTVSITDEEAYAAMEARWSDQGTVGLSVFLNIEGRWAEAIVEVEGGIDGVGQVHLVDGKIIIVGSMWGDGGFYEPESMSRGSQVVIVGTPAGG